MDERHDVLKRITADPAILGGKPIIRGMRISVELVLSLLAQGETAQSLLTDYPELESEDIRACLAYAHAVVARDRIDAIQGGRSLKFPIDRCGGVRLVTRLREFGHDMSEVR